MRNFYEKLVLESLDRRAFDVPLDDDLKEDIACLALNRLPPKYYRYEVDMSFFLSMAERSEMEKRVEAAVGAAIEFLAEEITRESLAS